MPCRHHTAYIPSALIAVGLTLREEGFSWGLTGPQQHPEGKGLTGQGEGPLRGQKTAQRQSPRVCPEGRGPMCPQLPSLALATCSLGVPGEGVSGQCWEVSHRRGCPGSGPGREKAWEGVGPETDGSGAPDGFFCVLDL